MKPVRDRNPTKRTQFYTRWRRKLGNRMYVMDIDQIEYRAVGGQLLPVGVLELTVVKPPVSSQVLKKIYERLSTDSPQGKVLRAVAEALGVYCYAVVLESGSVQIFRCWNMTTDQHRLMNQEQYLWWLRNLRPISRRPGETNRNSAMPNKPRQSLTRQTCPNRP